jgi:hypothetical protein
VDKTRLPGFQWKSCDMSYALSVMDVIIAADGSVLEFGLTAAAVQIFKRSACALPTPVRL